MKFFFTLFIGLFLYSGALKSQSTELYNGWIDTAFALSERRDFDELLTLSGSVIEKFEQTTSHHLAFAHLFQAKMYHLRSQLDQSEAALQSARKLIQQDHLQNDSLQFLLLRYSGDQALYQNDLNKSDSLYSLAPEYGERAFGKNSFQMALFNSSLESLYRFKGKKYEALAAAKKALDIGYVVFDSLAPPMAGFENNYGIEFSELDKTRQAAIHLNRAMEILMHNKGEQDIGIIQILNNLGSLENTLGNYRSALSHIQRGIKIYDNWGTAEYNDMIIDLLYNGAFAYVKLDDLSRAEEYMQQASRYIDENMAFYKYYSGAIDLDIAMHARLGGQFELGKEKALNSLKKYVEAFGEDDPETVYPLSELAFNALNQENFAQSIDYLQECIHLLETNEMTTSENGGDFYGWVGEIYDMQKKYTEAIPYLEKSLSIYRAVYGLNNQNVAWAFSSIGRAQIGLNEIQKGRTYIDSAWIASMKPNKKYTSGSVPAIEDIVSHVYLRDIILDECHYLNARYIQTQDLKYLKKGIQFISLADRLIDNQRSTYKNSSSTAGFISRNYHLYEWGLLFANTLREASGNEHYIDTAFYFTEKSKSAALYNLVSGIELKNEEKIPTQLIHQLNELELDKNNLTVIIQEERSYGTEADQSQISKWEKQLFTSDEAYTELRNEIKTKYAKYFNITFNTAVVDLTTIQNELPRQTTLIEYMFGDSLIHALVVDKKNKKHVILGQPENLSEQIERLNQSITNRDHSATENLVDSIHQIIFAPLEEYLIHSDLVIIPDGPLHYLNFEILPDRKNEKQYLIYNYEISYEHSASYLVLKEAKQSNQPTNNWLGLAPGFSDQMKEKYKSSIPEADWDAGYLGLLRQPNSEVLIAGIGQKKSGDESFIGNEANESNLLKRIGQFSTIHFSTHADVNNLDPSRSKLVLAKPILADSHDDGNLTIGEIYNLSLHSNLVVLTACNTGLGKLHRGDGMTSLARGFQYAGAKNIIMSLWSVDEQQSNVLMDEFYNSYNAGTSIVSSLRQAKLAYLENQSGELAQPFYWAGLVSIGTELSTPSSFFGQPFFIGILIGLFLILIVLAVRSRINS